MHEHAISLQCMSAHQMVLSRYDGPQSNELKLLIETFWASGKVVSAVCHGPAALITVSGPDGNLIIKGKKVILLMHLAIAKKCFVISLFVRFQLQ